MPFNDSEELRQKIIGLGESSVRKSYYPQLQERLLELERFHALLDRSREIIILVEVETRLIIDFNATLCSLLEASRESLLRSDITQWMPIDINKRMQMLAQERKLEASCVIETMMQNSEGIFPVEFVLQYVHFNDQDYFVILGKDISERKHAESKIHTLAFYDSLTNLPNRQLFYDRLAQALAKSHRHHKYSALLMIDLDNFKALNDTKGHHIGDELLKQVADRIQSVLKEGDTLGHIGGDTFIVLLEAVSLEKEATALESEKFAMRVKHLINQP